MEEAVRLNAAELASTEADTESLPRCEHALELLLAAEQSGDLSNSAYSENDAKVERDARVLVQSEAEAKKPRATSASLKALLHERAVIERALELGGAMLTELRAAWAQQVLAERSKEYRSAVRQVALAIEALKKADSNMQGLLKLFGAAGRNSGLPCANVNVALGLNNLSPFTNFALRAGIVTKGELSNV